MVTPDFARLMAAYNAEMNRRFYGAAATLDDAARKADRGAFFGSIHRTFNHLIWADQVWCWRLTGRDRPETPRADGPDMIADFDVQRAERVRLDGVLTDWAAGVGADWLSEPHVWFEGTARAFETPRAVLVAHVFNHQTHHRGQVHAMLTAAGADTAQTDLWVVEHIRAHGAPPPP